MHFLKFEHALKTCKNVTLRKRVKTFPKHVKTTKKHTYKHLLSEVIECNLKTYKNIEDHLLILLISLKDDHKLTIMTCETLKHIDNNKLAWAKIGQCY